MKDRAKQWKRCDAKLQGLKWQPAAFVRMVLEAHPFFVSQDGKVLKEIRFMIGMKGFVPHHKGVGNMNVSSVNSNSTQISKLYEKLSSGKKINSASDDAAGLVKAQRLEEEIRKQQAQERNYAMSQAKSAVADGAYSGMMSYAQDISAYEVMSGNATYTDSDLSMISTAVSSLTDGITDLESQTTYNTQQVVSDGTVDTSSASAMISSISSAQSSNGAYYNALTYSRNVSSITAINTIAAKSKIEDTDMAATVSELKKETALQRYREQMQKKRQEEEAKRANSIVSNTLVS